MPTKRELVSWAELLKLIAEMVIAAVRHCGDDDPIDFEAIKIRVSPEQALAQAGQAQSAHNSEASERPSGQTNES